VLQADPSNQGGTENEVEEAFVGDGENDEDRGEGEADYDESVEVVVVWSETMEEWEGE
jgi:hypothetical protein